ncbi:hypothetical protein NBRC116588_32160 [Pyruvatibacter sp. HU-CL02332]
MHKRWGEALPHSVPPQPCYRSHMHSDTGLAMCRVRMHVHRGDLTLRAGPSLRRLAVTRVRYPQAPHKAIRPRAQARTVRDALKHEAYPV